MTKPKLLDAFCGAGGCTRGYQDAGFYVVGVDIKPQPRYIGDEFHQGDAIEFITAHGAEFDVIHTSPPCQAYSEATPTAYRESHPDLIPATRAALQATGKPYVIENVENARVELVNPVKLCGSMFGLPIWRHRYFEIYPPIFLLTVPCNHNRRPIAATINQRARLVEVPVLCTGGGDGQRAKRKTHRPRGKVEEIRWAMDIDWMVQAELTQAIPPAYTRWIGERLIEIL